MYSKIYQISTSPILPEDYISECDFIDHWFVGSVANKVSSENDRDEDVRDFRDSLTKRKAARFHGNKNSTAVSFVLLPNGKEAYFTPSYKTFTSAREKAMGIGLQEFATGSAFDSLMWEMREAYCAKFSFYVSFDDEVMPLDKFVRQVDIGTRYYIGGTLNYHF